MTFTLRKLLMWVVVMGMFLFLCSTAISYRNHMFSFHFVDEEDNMVIAKYLNEGTALYKDVFSQHQPLAYVLSSAVQKVLPLSNINELIQRHREVIVLWSFAWYIVLLVRFRLFVIPFVVFTELLKFYLLGNLFLAESLVIYPICYSVVSLILTPIPQKKSELLFLGICLGTIVLLLAPAWPLSVVMFLLLLYKNRNQLVAALLWIILGALPIVLICLPFVSLPYYIQNAIVLNFKYYIPLTNHDPLHYTLLKAFITPFVSIFPPYTSVTKLSFVCISILLIASWTWFGIQRKYAFIITSWFLIAVANIRYIAPGTEFYQGFHLLPAASLLMVFASIGIITVITKSTNYLIRLSYTLLLLVVGVTVALLTYKDVFRTRDRMRDFEVNYSRQYYLGELIRQTKSANDTLFVAPDESIIYWQANIKPATPYLYYYDWMVKVPDIKQAITRTFEQQRPEYYYCACEPETIQYTLSDHYKRLLRKDMLTGLFIKPEKLASLSDKQKEHMQSLGFSESD